MTPEQAEIVAKARENIVREFRAGRGGYSAPDHPASPWYNPDEWDDQGNYYGPHKPMMPKPVNKATPEETELTGEESPELTSEAKKEARRVYMREYMKKKRQDTGE